MTEIYVYHVSNRKRSLAAESFILCYFMQKKREKYLRDIKWASIFVGALQFLDQ